MSYMKHNKKRKQTLESAQYGLEIFFKETELSDLFHETVENKIKPNHAAFMSHQVRRRPHYVGGI